VSGRGAVGFGEDVSGREGAVSGQDRLRLRCAYPDRVGAALGGPFVKTAGLSQGRCWASSQGVAVGEVLSGEGGVGVHVHVCEHTR
jgi:hypothetical protein